MEKKKAIIVISVISGIILIIVVLALVYGIWFRNRKKKINEDLSKLEVNDNVNDNVNDKVNDNVDVSTKDTEDTTGNTS